MVLTMLFLHVVLPSLSQNHKSDALPDVLQHVPMAAALTLRAVGCDSHSASWGEFALSAASSYVLAAGTTYALKHCVGEQRPDKSDRRSFPSGHATFAFAGATVLHHEYGHLSPWVSIGGYTVATLTAVHRVCQDRHYAHDVIAGAAIGFGATELTYFIKRKLLRNRNIDMAFSSHSVSFAVWW